MLGISAALRASTAISYPLFNSQNRVKLSFYYNIFGTILLVISILVSLPFGLEVVAGAISANALFSVILFWASLRLIGLGLRAVLHVLLRPVIASLLMWSAIFFLRSQVQADALNIVLHLFLMIACGATVYCITLIALSRQYLQEFIALANKLLKRDTAE
jgi:PST family polysaccharide transporter